MRTLCAGIGAGILAGCTHSTPVLPPPSAPEIIIPVGDEFNLQIPLQKVPIEPCGSLPLTRPSVPPNFEFRYYNCVGTDFNDIAKGKEGLKARTEAAGKRFIVYSTVKQNGIAIGKVVLFYTPVKPLVFHYRDSK
jgi:hypothetical protein